MKKKWLILPPWWCNLCLWSANTSDLPGSEKVNLWTSPIQASHPVPPATLHSKLLWSLFLLLRAHPFLHSHGCCSFPRPFQIVLFYHLHLTWNITSLFQQGFAWFLILFQPPNVQPKQRSFQRRYNALSKSKKDMKPKPWHILLIY